MDKHMTNRYKSCHKIPPKGTDVSNMSQNEIYLYVTSLFKVTLLYMVQYAYFGNVVCSNIRNSQNFDLAVIFIVMHHII